MTERRSSLFVALIAVQAIHAFEECWFRLYAVFPPAAFVARLVSRDPAWGFAVANIALLNLALWCYVECVRPGHRSATVWLWAWTLLALGNGISHLTFAVLGAGYFPGVMTAPLLLGVGLALGAQLRRPARLPV